MPLLAGFLSLFILEVFWFCKVRQIWGLSRTCSVDVPQEDIGGQPPLLPVTPPKAKQWEYTHKIYKPQSKQSAINTKIFTLPFIESKSKTKQNKTPKQKQQNKRTNKKHQTPNEQANTWTYWSPNIFYPRLVKFQRSVGCESGQSFNKTFCAYELFM